MGGRKAGRVASVEKRGGFSLSLIDGTCVRITPPPYLVKAIVSGPSWWSQMGKDTAVHIASFLHCAENREVGNDDTLEGREWESFQE